MKKFCVYDMFVFPGPPTGNNSLTFVDKDQNEPKQQQHSYTDNHSDDDLRATCKIYNTRKKIV